MPLITNKTKSTKKAVPNGSIFQKINQPLSFIFYLIWIIIGLFLILLIMANIRQGLFRQLFATPQEPSKVEVPTETTLSGIGKVNIECIQSALESETIGKIIEEQSTASLTDEEKAKLEPCIIEKESSSASPR